MYWPIGAPRVYAASNTKAPRPRTLEIDDDPESRETTDGSGSLVDDSNNVSYFSREDENEEGPSGVSTPVTPVTPGIQPVEHDTNRRFPIRSAGDDSVVSGAADKEPLLSLKISRTGHLFAVITSTSLTIWQTKVCSCKPLTSTLLMILIANRHIGSGDSFQEVSEYLRSQCFPSRSPRLCDIRCSDNFWILNHLHTSHGSGRPSIQAPFLESY